MAQIDYTQKISSIGGILNEPPYVVKDSGTRIDLPGGMHRDTNEGKIDYSLVFDGPMLKRWADHLTKGAVKYNKRNWMLGEGEEVEQRFKESLVRHFFEYLEGKTDEDHAAAVMFNINGLEYVREKNKHKKKDINWLAEHQGSAKPALKAYKFTGIDRV